MAHFVPRNPLVRTRLLGALTRAPYASDALVKALAAGPLTFEAEHMAGDRLDTLASEAGASGGMFRRSSPRFRERAESFVLVKGQTPRLPDGRYTTRAWLRLHCGGFRGEHLGRIKLSTHGKELASRVLDCKSPVANDASGFSVWELSFDLPASDTIELAVSVDQGEVALDRITLLRTRPRTTMR